MSSKLFGKWKLSKNHNFDEYMKKVGVDAATRKIASVISSTTKILDEGNNQVRIKTKSTFKSANVVFPIGEEIDEHTMDDRDCKTVVTWDGESKLIEIQKWKDQTGDRQLKMEWAYEDEKMILRMECDGIKAERHHTRTKSKKDKIN
uniref:fatty acid-binding protein, brain-like isoform X1 n=1 Tax=Styela clava TaxID=7725 RepID=UPI00193A1F9A|nr:fatty acid-binding protein, brain-like isoform X1 [Styela clava]